MPELKGTKTHESLKEAFAGESQANRRYLYFAKQADIEGYPDIAGLFQSVIVREEAVGGVRQRSAPGCVIEREHTHNKQRRRHRAALANSPKVVACHPSCPPSIDNRRSKPGFVT